MNSFTAAFFFGCVFSSKTGRTNKGKKHKCMTHSVRTRTQTTQRIKVFSGFHLVTCSYSLYFPPFLFFCLFQHGSTLDLFYVWPQIVTESPSCRRENKSHSTWLWKVLLELLEIHGAFYSSEKLFFFFFFYTIRYFVVFLT